ncbi:AraC family transcriptional regulator [uncultured Tateyamaria sp.]|uniref:helix-turn-helix domain-containing protein n=1 Tax=uncultured Tateyamaria sp. TaxID=455651 RepID=UPI00261EDFCB|nr:AraC family transcriptional regulator [uncultured Tateyamaria sp.]
MTIAQTETKPDAVRVVELAGDANYVQGQFIRHAATLGSQKIGVFDVVNNPAGAYPDPPLAEYSLQLATAKAARAEFDLGAGPFHTTFGRGTAILAPPGADCDYILESSFSLINVGLPLPLFDEAMRAFNGAHKPDLERLHTMAFRDPRIETMCTTIAQNARSGGSTDALAVDHAAFGIAALLVDKAGKVTRYPGTPAPLSDAEFSSVLDLMHDRIEEGVTLTDLARLSGRDVYQFSRAFRLRAGVAPYKFLIWMRLDRARDLLAATDLPLVEIAYACGFSSQAHLTTVFRKTLGTTPGVYRNRH